MAAIDVDGNDVVWDAAEELDMTIGVHEGSQPATPTLPRLVFLEAGGGWAP